MISKEQFKDKKIIFLIAGEASGDKLGAELIKSIKNYLGEEKASQYVFTGIGGERMQKEGFSSLFDYSQLSIMGLSEVLPKIFQMKKLINLTVEYVKTLDLEIFISIDSPGFNIRVAKALKSMTNRTFPLVHYVAPTVWAWKPGRALKYSLIFDKILCLFPFEPPYFEKVGLSATFVGHPAALEERVDVTEFQKIHNLIESDQVVLVLPGSRKMEVTKLLDIFAETATEVSKNVSNCKFIISAVPHLEEYIRGQMENFPANTIVVNAVTDGRKAINSSMVALAASGTVALELARFEVAQTTAYKVSPVSAFIAKFLVKTDFANLINIIHNQAVIPERIQQDCNVGNLSEDIRILLTDENQRLRQNKFQREAINQLKVDELLIARTLFEMIA